MISCIDEIDIVAESDFESLLVIEAVITNEDKIHEITLSRVAPLNTEENIPEMNASVRVIDDVGNNYVFIESSEGNYRSSNSFRALPDRNYILEIQTTDGDLYQSSLTSLTSETPIGELYAELGFNENASEGIIIKINSNDELGNTNYYRFEYEETYKIVAPLYNPKQVLINNEPNFPLPIDYFSDLSFQELIDYLVNLEFRPEQEQTCYNTVASNEIMIASTTELENDIIEQYQIRFINRENTIISHRYSILVRQFILSQEAYNYYRTLESFSSEEDLFSQVQTGFLVGNISNINNQEERVVGLFEVSAVDEKRIFFNYSDLYPNEPLPEYFVNCDYREIPGLLQISPLPPHNIIRSPLQSALKTDLILYRELFDSNNGRRNPPFELVLEPCGDCTIYGENVVPDFWQE